MAMVKSIDTKGGGLCIAVVSSADNSENTTKMCKDNRRAQCNCCEKSITTARHQADTHSGELDCGKNYHFPLGSPDSSNQLPTKEDTRLSKRTGLLSYQQPQKGAHLQETVFEKIEDKLTEEPKGLGTSVSVSSDSPSLSRNDEALEVSLAPELGATEFNLVTNREYQQFAPSEKYSVASESYQRSFTRSSQNPDVSCDVFVNPVHDSDSEDLKRTPKEFQKSFEFAPEGNDEMTHRFDGEGNVLPEKDYIVQCLNWIEKNNGQEVCISTADPNELYNHHVNSNKSVFERQQTIHVPVKNANSIVSENSETEVLNTEKSFLFEEGPDSLTSNASYLLSTASTGQALKESKGTSTLWQYSVDKLKLEDAILHLKDVPEKLEFKNSRNFTGESLVTWLCSAFGDHHCLYHRLSEDDLRIVAAQMCSHLLSGGVLQPDRTDSSVFELDAVYHWSRCDHVSLLTSWPPSDQIGIKPGISPTDVLTDCQTLVSSLKKEHRQQVEDLKHDHDLALLAVRGDYHAHVIALENRIRELELHIGTLNQAKPLVTTQDVGTDVVHIQLLKDWMQSLDSTVDTSTKIDTLEPSDCVTEDINLGPISLSAIPSPSSDDVFTPPSQKVPPPAPPPPPGCPLGPPPVPGLPPPCPDIPIGGLQDKSKEGPRRPPVLTKSPMKPLFWKRIQLTLSSLGESQDESDNNAPIKSLWETISEPEFCVDEFDELFSRSVVTKKKPQTEKKKKKVREVAKLLDDKRSQSVGILIRSLHLDSRDIENALLLFDSSAVDLDTLQAINEMKPTTEEVERITSHLETLPDIPLDTPEKFLYDVAKIPCFSDRIFCMTFQTMFHESIGAIEAKLNNLKMTCDTLLTDESLHQVMALLLALGNYMNGGNRMRGQADGFSLEILSKLKDVKSKDNSGSLLHYLVHEYVTHFDPDSGTDRAVLPTPHPSDISQASLVSFEDIRKDLDNLKTHIKGCESRLDKVLSSPSEDFVEPFRRQMEAFLSLAHSSWLDEVENLRDCQRKFEQVTQFFMFGGDKQPTPHDFFSLWTGFCEDFKNLWRKEEQKNAKKRLLEAQKKVDQLKTIKTNDSKIKTRDKRVGGLKAKLARKGMLTSN